MTLSNPIRILVVDDEPELLETVSLVLSMEQYAVTTTGDPQQALQWLQGEGPGARPFDLVVTDVNMPGMTGLELVREARRRRIEVPILVMTGYGTRSTVIELLRAGVGDYLDKPFQAEELRGRVRSLLARVRPRPESLAPSGAWASTHAMVGGLLHDVNNTLAVILGNAELAVHDTPQSGPVQQEVRNIAEAARTARDIIHRYQQHARDERNNQWREVDAHEVIRRAVALATPCVRNVLSIHCRLLAPAAAVNGDRGLLTNALLNLLFNCRDAVGRGGNVWITTSTCDSGRLLISVRDDGAGMSPDVQAHLFEPGYTTKERGNGLGLPMVKRCLDYHGGEITVRSSEQKGTEFELSLPLQP